MIRFDQGRLRFNYRNAGVAIDHDCVLVHRSESDDFWALPGGRAELMEEATVTLRREMQEEIGVEVQVGPLLWVVEDFFDFQGYSFHELGLYFSMKLPENCPLLARRRFDGLEMDSASGSAHLIFEWHRLADLPDERLYPAFLRTALQALPASTQHIVADER